MNAGFIGLGHLGKTIAQRLISEGTGLVVWNRTREKALELGCPIAESPADLVSRTDTVFLSLFDSAAVRSVIEGSTGILQGNCRNKIVIDTTTNHFESVVHFRKVLGDHGASYLEAPVLGSVVPAAQGSLTLLVSGDKDTYAKVRPLLEKIGKNIFYLEEPALATKMKLINNLVLGSLMATIAEAVSFGEDLGIDRALVLDILGSGAGNSMVLNAKREKLIREDFTAHFSSSLIYKDLHYMQDLAKALQRPLFTASIVKELYAMACAGETESLDFSAVYKVLKEYQH